MADSRHGQATPPDSTAGAQYVPPERTPFREGCCLDWPKPCSYHEGWDDALGTFQALPLDEQMAFLGLRKSKVHEHKTGTCWRQP